MLTNFFKKLFHKDNPFIISTDAFSPVKKYYNLNHGSFTAIKENATKFSTFEEADKLKYFLTSNAVSFSLGIEEY